MWAIDTAGLADGERAELVRDLLKLVRPVAARFQTDVPWGTSTSWPADVEAAATVLAPGRRYASTGWLDAEDDRAWGAYVCLAPFAYSSDVWAADGVELVSLADEGTSVSVRAHPAVRAGLERIVPAARLLPSP